MKVICSVICCLLLVSSCQDEPITSMEEINDQWSEKNTESQQAELVIEEVMKKYNAHSYEVTGLQDSDPPRAAFILRNYQKEAIKGISADDQARMATAIARINTLREDMSRLEDVDEIFTVVEEQPMPKGGMEAFYKYVQESLKYPAQAREMGIEGKVFVQYVVNDFGEISDVKVVKGIGAGCDEAAAQVVKNSPAWLPGRQNGEAVKVRMVIPINFKLKDA